MAGALKSRYWLVTLLASSAFATMTVAVMMGPVLIPLAAEFHTSVAGAGQLAAVILIGAVGGCAEWANRWIRLRWEQI